MRRRRFVSLGSTFLTFFCLGVFCPPAPVYGGISNVVTYSDGVWRSRPDPAQLRVSELLQV
ncbi:MAG: hypothetical protein WCG06_06540, partial [Candidatus Omnitrophota bacterium]